jgi:hypothetical protein
MPTLLFLIDDTHRIQTAAKGKYPFGDRSNWNAPYHAGMLGLCQVGAAGASMIQPLLQRLDQGVLNKGDDQTVRTMVAIGADPEEIWKRVRTGKPDENRRAFDFAVARARRKGGCEW